MHIQNAWYVAAMSSEVTDKPLGRTICNHNLVMYRGKDDAIACIEDFCPHRGAAMSLGYVEEGELVCGYHGLRMGPDGQTISMPKQRTDRFPCTRSFPVMEKYGFIWVWPGDKAQADESKLPKFHWAEIEGWAYGGGLFHIKCDYRLMIDNLMDLTHETYVHSTSIGQKEIDEAPVKTRMEGDQVITERFMPEVKAPPFWQMAMEFQGLDPNATVDRWQICRFNAPSHIMIDVGVALAGNGGIDAPLEKRASSVVVDFITPETDSTMHYFWGMARNFQPEDAALTDKIREGQGGIFTEDLEVLEAQQKNLDRYPDRDLLKLDIDAGGVQARRMIERAIKLEQEAGNA
ncbi:MULTISPECIES: aromatic ring-hydroxylating dioxygenase subunit alpha [unclassified Marinobacterium]|uniref:aromatic ring-hydroxylating dioxygenase subunit alpha n=1 Tax=unclassified Marinobacterium TaxID=2644139 RepID=UPI00156A5F89|nr:MULTISPECIES: aromatic ring-hydroxylating dioxygenase subunit alpha [unclassified Marinobacterium]NRP51722.1 Toluene-4-sulfonate monooxygenase system iron-sulfur subunit TsaM1 [Marinobacterium sp. xm-v-242]NRP76303.1 Toluene-4-sulfonate monooxygenase system iron-sulfur subunit TsaM1 [Marinobacterium sp. xm-m-383]